MYMSIWVIRSQTVFQDSEWNIKIFPRQAGTEQRQKVDQWLPRAVGRREWEMSTE